MGFGKNSRPGKRSASSSSYLSTITTVGFVALCVLGVWMLTSSSIVPAQTTRSNSGSDPLSSSSRLGRSAVVDRQPTFDDADIADDQDLVMSSLGRKSGRPGKVDDDDGVGDVGKMDEKPLVEEESRQIAVGESDEGDGKQQESNADGNEGSGGKDEVVVEDDRGKEAASSVEKDTHVTEDAAEGQPQSEESNENQQQQQELQVTGEGNEENQQQQSNQGEDEIDKTGSEENQNHQAEDEVDRARERPQEQETSDSQTNEESQHQSQQEQEQEQQQQEQQRQEQQQQEPEQQEQEQQQQEQEQQQQAENDEGHQQSHQSNEESGGDGINEQHSQQQSEGENSDGNQQRSESEREEEDHQQSQQQQVAEDESNGENNQQQQSQEAVDESHSVENHESQQGDDGITAGEETHQSEGKLLDPHAADLIRKESKGHQQGSAWSTQAGRSENEKERQESSGSQGGGSNIYGYTWELCNVTAGTDYIPCLDNEKALKQLHTTGHYEHRERHCPEESPSCLVPLPEGYKQSIEWPKSRDKIWYKNVPHTKLAVVKGHQNWVKVMGEYLTFPGGGTQFIHGALHYIDFIQQAVPKIAWGKRTRVILDVGCGVASFGGFLFERDVLAMSFAPKDEHEAQVQFALERGIPAISAVMGSQRLSFPSRVFDIVHCARCRVPWHAEGGTLLLELNRVLRPGGYFVWSATPVYQKLKEDVEIWKAMSSLTASMCWELVTIKKDKLNSVGAAIYRKPTSNDCYNSRKRNNPPMCKEDDDPNAAWYVPLQACMHKVPLDSGERGSRWPKDWPLRLQQPPYWLNNTQVGVYGKPAPADFVSDYEHWKRVVSKSYLSGLGISWSNVRNVMDMRAVYGGFAAALNDLKVWVMNVVNVDSPDTLPIIYERGLFGIYHDWCESFSTYPRTYDLLHADHLFSNLKKRCKIMPVMAEIDRIVRPGGKLIVRDKSSVVSEVENLLKSLHWEVRLTFSKDQIGLLSAQKTNWRPETFLGSS